MLPDDKRATPCVQIYERLIKYFDEPGLLDFSGVQSSLGQPDVPGVLPQRRPVEGDVLREGSAQAPVCSGSRRRLPGFELGLALLELLVALL